MSINYPSAIDVFTNPSGTSTLDSPDHSLQHSDANDAIEAIEAVIGTTAGTSVLKDFSAGEFPVRQEGGTVSPGTLTFDSPTLGTPAITGGTATGLTLAGTPVLNATSAVPFYNDSIHRQAIINGNFDVWQRGTSSALSISVNGYTVADRWRNAIGGDSGTLPTVTVSRQSLTTGDIDNSFYYYRLATDGAGASLGTNSICYNEQRIENGVRYLCGNGKKVTLSFYAKSDIADKKLGYALQQNYGTGGSPTSTEIITGQSITLTSTWTRYTYTFTTNTLASKTFGTRNDDYLRLMFFYQWGSSQGTTYGLGSAEDYGGSGNIDIAQVQLCAGDVALPFMPKSFEEEEINCKKYYQVYGGLNSYDRLPVFGIIASSATAAEGILQHEVEMRAKPTFAYTGTIGNFRLISGSSAVTVSALSTNSAQSNSKLTNVKITTASGLIDTRAYILRPENDIACTLTLSAEL